ncbi:MAG: alpha/beta hydrolase [Actinomycetota bacterium]|nr:alpha/beta hydrolase [Actinomycetota bacterium]
MLVQRLGRRHRAQLAALVCGSLLLTACTSTVSGKGTAAGAGPASPTAPAVTVTPIRFNDCSSAFNLSSLTFPAGREAHLSFLCGKVAVPLSYADPTGRSIDIAMVKVHDDRNPTANDLVVNPGGPGGSGIDLAVSLSAQLAGTVLSHFDVVGFDPRGVGLSSPISCVSNTQKDALNDANPDIRTSAGFAQAKSLAKSVADSCTAKYGAALANYDTVNTAKDIDLIREGLGAKQLNYLGFSYGTELGAVYAHLFPRNVRVAVLDGAVDPLTDDITSFADQLGGFEGAFDQFASDCLTRSDCKSLGNPRQVVYGLTRQANQTPLKSSDSAEHRTASGSIVLTGVLSALYSKSQWPALGQALIAAQGGDAKGLFALADQYNERQPDGTYSNIYDANTTISCNDSKPGPTDAQVTATLSKWVNSYPMFGLWAAASLFSCQQWQATRAPVPLPAAATPQKVLVIGNLHDPATPYQGAKDLTTALGNAELLTWDGEGHTSYLQGSSCIDSDVNAYLVSGTLPPVATTCPR